MNGAVMRLLPISLCVSPSQHVEAETDVFGSQFTLECVLASAPMTVAGDGVSIEGHRDIVRHLLPGAQGIRTLMGFSTPRYAVHGQTTIARARLAGRRHPV
jgi:hypothetical protein